MPELPHLILPRAEVDMDRRKRPGFGKQAPRNATEQTARVSKQLMKRWQRTLPCDLRSSILR